MSDRPLTPLADMDYLDGYLDFVYTNDDAPDGAWFAMCVDTIAEHWPEEEDAHECFMQYIQWKNPQKEKEDGYQESRKEETREQEGGEQEDSSEEQGRQEARKDS